MSNDKNVDDDLFNKFFNLKFMPELHVPSHQYLGPFTNLQKRLERGDPGINPLDRAAWDHDIFYSLHQDSTFCHRADKELENKASERVKASDSSVSEKKCSLFCYLAAGSHHSRLIISQSAIRSLLIAFRKIYIFLI